MYGTVEEARLLSEMTEQSERGRGESESQRSQDGWAGEAGGGQ